MLSYVTRCQELKNETFRKYLNERGKIFDRTDQGSKSGCIFSQQVLLFKNSRTNRFERLAQRRWSRLTF